MNNFNLSEKLDLVLAEQKKLRTIIDSIEVSILDEVKKNRKEIKKVGKEVSGLNQKFIEHEDRITSLEENSRFSSVP